MARILRESVEKNSHQKVYFVGFFTFISLILVFLAISVISNYGKITTQTNLLIPTPFSEKGVLRFESKDNVTSYKTGKKATIVIYAASGGSSISGYDVSLNYNPEVLRFISASNLVSEFKIYTKKKEGKIVLTGIKDLEAQKSYIFDNTPIIEIEFLTRAPGVSNIVADFLPGATADSNLVDDMGKERLGQVEPISLVVGK